MLTPWIRLRLLPWARHRTMTWLVAWVFWLDLTLEIVTLGFLRLGRWPERAHAWLVSKVQDFKGYVDTGEGPFDTYAEAAKFASAEVGTSWKIRYDRDGWHVLCIPIEDSDDDRYYQDWDEDISDDDWDNDFDPTEDSDDWR